MLSLRQKRIIVSVAGSGDVDGDFYDYDIDASFDIFDWTELGPSITVYAITFLLGIVGNVLILVIRFKDPWSSLA